MHKAFTITWHTVGTKVIDWWKFFFSIQKKIFAVQKKFRIKLSAEIKKKNLTSCRSREWWECLSKKKKKIRHPTDKMNFLTIPFFVKQNMECSRTRLESHFTFADHQMHDDIFPRYLLDYFFLQIMSHYCELLFIVQLLCSCHTYQNKRSLYKHFMLQSGTKENNIML